MKNTNAKRVGVIKKRVGAAVTFQRVVTNDWSKISLRVMLDAAQEIGYIFRDYDPLSSYIKLPGELEPICQKAISQGKAVRNGEIKNPFTSSEMQLTGKYIHCSAHWNSVVIKDVWLDGAMVKAIYGGVKTPEVLFFVNRPNPGWVRSV